MQELEVTWGRAISVWWLITWRSAVFGALAGAVAFAVIFRGILLWHWNSQALVGCEVAIYFFSLLIQLAVVRSALKKRYENFSIALLPAQIYNEDAEADPYHNRIDPSFR